MSSKGFATVEGASLKFKHPFSLMACGPSGCGKTSWILNLVKHKDEVITPKITRVIYSYRAYQRAFDDAIAEGLNVEFVYGAGYKIDPRENTLLIVDDQLLNSSIPLGHTFTVKVHHDNMSCIFVTHNLFHKDPEFRLASLNAHYVALFKSIRNVGQVNTLARQLFTHDKEKGRKMVRAYAQATKDPYTYLLIDLKPCTPDNVRLRSHVLPDEGPTLGDARLTKTYPL